MKAWQLSMAWAVLGLAAAAGCSSSESTPVAASIAGQPASEKAPAKPAEDLLRPKVLIQTSLGDVTVQLDAQKAPLTVGNFLDYVDRGHYDGTIFHQAIKGRAVIGGGFTADLQEKKGRTPVRNEARNGLRNARGTVAMARQPGVIHSATSQFFFNLADNEWLDYKDDTPEGYGYCVFGQVVAGADVLDRIASSPVRDAEQFEQLPVETVAIKSIRRVK